jgi:hypothetical protein
MLPTGPNFLTFFLVSVMYAPSVFAQAPTKAVTPPAPITAISSNHFCNLSERSTEKTQRVDCESTVLIIDPTEQHRVSCTIRMWADWQFQQPSEGRPGIPRWVVVDFQNDAGSCLIQRGIDSSIYAFRTQVGPELNQHAEPNQPSKYPAFLYVSYEVLADGPQIKACQARSEDVSETICGFLTLRGNIATTTDGPMAKRAKSDGSSSDQGGAKVYHPNKIK